MSQHADLEGASTAAESLNSVKHMICRASGGEAAARAVHLVGGGKTATWLKNFGFPSGLETFAKLGFRS